MQETWEDPPCCFHLVWGRMRSGSRIQTRQKKKYLFVSLLQSQSPWALIAIIVYLTMTYPELQCINGQWFMYIRLWCHTVYFSNLGLQTELMSSSLASRIQAPIYCFTGNAFWWPSKSLSKTVGRPAIVQGLSQIITVSQRVTRITSCWRLLRHYLLNPVFSSWPRPYLNCCEEITHPVRNNFVSVSETAKVCH